MTRQALICAMLAALLASSSVDAQQPTVRAGQQALALTPLDYVEIQQLVAKYAYALDSGGDNGYMYADLFTPDGVFTGMNQGPTGRSYAGRDTLAALARGGRRGPLYVSHFIMNVIITPSPGGATGKQYLAILNIGDGQNPSAVDHGGQYEDEYVKTAKGWRFKSRTFYGSEGGADPLQLKKRPAPPDLSAAARVEQPGPAVTRGMLSVEDYLEIQQLIVKYGYALDTGADNGLMYADLFAPDGEFIRPPTKGRENLAKLALDQPHGPQYVRHYLANHLIEPSSGGATGKEYLVVIDIGEGGKPSGIFIGGHYDDIYVKTAQGWRFKRREFIPSRSGVQPPEGGRGR